ncbi:hypothetical protein JM49_15410 [Pseudomonas chlororaphis subsp. aurantiaca]|uniref:hypothetical protein n=1 Tax=Pseudomonas chlororaphis TaxID=587753 RepID=UPI00050D5FCB|nr:hypothetical protein [Pseudomonas chlororaphis]AIS12994.1 hypothetical protein JM49_15410 [Pseudomonas chlororaphis subsp. aurantiaca]
MSFNPAALSLSSVVTPRTVPAVSTEPSVDEAQAAPQESVRVSLSEEGKAKAAKEQDKYADIDASNLPDNVKKLLKAIREIQEKIEEKMQELDAVKNDPSLSEKERQAKTQVIQVELSILSNQLTSRNNDLNKLQLSKADKDTAFQLLLSKG